MDFLIGILLIIIVMLILYNFSSVSMSNTKPNGSCNSNPDTTQYNMNNQYSNIPSPILSKSPSALNNKVNLNAQAYDYNKYFFA